MSSIQHSTAWGQLLACELVLWLSIVDLCIVAIIDNLHCQLRKELIIVGDLGLQHNLQSAHDEVM